MVSVDIVFLLALLILSFGGSFLIRQGRWILVWALLNGLIGTISFVALDRIEDDLVAQSFILALVIMPYAISTFFGVVIARIWMLNKGPEPWTRYKAMWAAILIMLAIISYFAFMMSL